MNTETIDEKIIELFQDIDDFYWVNGIPDYDKEKQLSLRIGKILYDLGGSSHLLYERVEILKKEMN